MNRLASALSSRTSGLLLFGLTPPRQGTAPERLKRIGRDRAKRLREGAFDGVMVYDVQDESSRTDSPRQYSAVRTLDTLSYARALERESGVDAVRFIAVSGCDPAALLPRLSSLGDCPVVVVGAPSSRSDTRTSVVDAIRLSVLAGNVAGAIAIPERHASKGYEDVRMLEKTRAGASFFVTQCIYDVDGAERLLADYSAACDRHRVEPASIILCFSPVPTAADVSFLEWLGISVPDELRFRLAHCADTLGATVSHIRFAIDRLTDFCRHAGIACGVSVESIISRKAGVDAARSIADHARSALIEHRRIDIYSSV